MVPWEVREQSESTISNGFRSPVVMRLVPGSADPTTISFAKLLSGKPSTRV